MNKNCQQNEETCSRYVERELTQDEQNRFVEHLNACPQCQQKVAQLENIRARLRSMASITPSREFNTVLRTRIQMSKNIGRGQWSASFDKFKFPAYTVSMAAVIATIYFLHINAPASDTALPPQSANLEHTITSDGEIQAGDIIYTVDVLTQSKRSHSIKVSEKRKAVVLRSMMIAPGAAIRDSVSSRASGGNLANEDRYSVSF